ncbi:hypothetical protein [Phyllobacterium sp. SB3]|uniref:hypothetical protein n=1 Tax=Phyllobacterium sp. SB3 TaxID=3156073 RepID=UPI0032AEEE35
MIGNPKFIVADEPVSALDVTVRAQVLDLFNRLQQQHGFSCLFISHDLGVVEAVADCIVVMCAGEIVESGQRALYLSNRGMTIDEDSWRRVDGPLEMLSV